MQEVLRFLSSIDPTGFFAMGVQFIQMHFGMAGVVAALILMVAIVILIVAKLLKIAFDVLRFVLLPAVVVTFVATFFLPFSFVYILPVSVALFSVVLFIKG